GRLLSSLGKSFVMANQAAYAAIGYNGNRSGGADGDRTDDLRLAKPALSQLSYSPISGASAGSAAYAPGFHVVGPMICPGANLVPVGQGRVELPTSRLSGVRSNHLSYWPVAEPFGRSRWPQSEDWGPSSPQSSVLPESSVPGN